MKKLIFLFSIVTLFISSCSSDPTKLNVADLKTPCDFVKAHIDNVKAQINLYKDNEDEPIDEWSKKDKEKLKKLQTLLDQMDVQGEKIIEADFHDDKGKFRDEAKDCNGWDDIEELNEELFDLERSTVLSICDCLMNANSEEEALKCKPGSSIEELRGLYYECEERESENYEEEATGSGCGGDICGEDDEHKYSGGCGKDGVDACGACGECGEGEDEEFCGADSCGDHHSCGSE